MSDKQKPTHPAYQDRLRGNRTIPCSLCGGTGRHYTDPSKKCPKCFGEGHIRKG